MDNINVKIDINNKVKKFYYDQIISDLQNGWIDYLNQRSMCEWLSDDENSWDEYNWEQWEMTDQYDWYNHCWKDWLKLNYYYHTQNPQNIFQHIIWDELLTEDKTKLKIIIYIILISFGNYIAN